MDRPARALPLPAEEVRRVLRHAVRCIAPAWMAGELDDLVQNAVLRLIRMSETEEWSARGTSYLWKVAHSVVMDEIRSRRRRRETGLDDSAETDHAPSAGEMSAQETLALRSALAEGLNGLAATRRSAVLLYLLGYSLEESATMLGWTTKQVDNRRYRGLTDLRRLLVEKGYGP